MGRAPIVHVLALHLLTGTCGVHGVQEDRPRHPSPRHTPRLRASVFSSHLSIVGQSSQLSQKKPQQIAGVSPLRRLVPRWSLPAAAAEQGFLLPPPIPPPKSVHVCCFFPSLHCERNALRGVHGVTVIPDSAWRPPSSSIWPCCRLSERSTPPPPTHPLFPGLCLAVRGGRPLCLGGAGAGGLGRGWRIIWGHCFRMSLTDPCRSVGGGRGWWLINRLRVRAAAFKQVSVTRWLVLRRPGTRLWRRTRLIFNKIKFLFSFLWKLKFQFRFFAVKQQKKMGMKCNGDIM